MISSTIKILILSGNNINNNISLPQFDLDVKLGDNYATGKILFKLDFYFVI